jgi:hypothetical protein
MSSRVAYPFLVLSDDAVSLKSWLIGEPGIPLEEAEDILPNWDYERDLEISTSLSIDWEKAATSLQIPKKKLLLKVVLLAGTGVGNLPRRQDRLTELIVGQSSPEVDLVAMIHGRTLSGRLRLSLQVLLEAPLKASHVLSPFQRGSRLWQTHFDMLIEDGGDSRFPVETVSFSEIFHGLPQENAPWYLHWKTNVLHEAFSGAVRLYVNSDHEEIATRFAQGDGPTLQAMLADVMSQMMSSVLDHDEGEQLLDGCEEGSVGRQIRRWLDVAFPQQELKNIQAMQTHLPGRYRAAVLAAADMEANQ